MGCATSPPHHPQYDTNRTELLKLLLTCFSETVYQPPAGKKSFFAVIVSKICIAVKEIKISFFFPPEISPSLNRWIQHLTSADNRHALPLFTSLLNSVCAYDPVGMGVPYNHLLFSDSMEPLVDVALQILIVTLDHDTNGGSREHEEVNIVKLDKIIYL